MSLMTGAPNEGLTWTLGEGVPDDEVDRGCRVSLGSMPPDCRVKGGGLSHMDTPDFRILLSLLRVSRQVGSAGTPIRIEL